MLVRVFEDDDSVDRYLISGDTVIDGLVEKILNSRINWSYD